MKTVALIKMDGRTDRSSLHLALGDIRDMLNPFDTNNDWVTSALGVTAVVAAAGIYARYSYNKWMRERRDPSIPTARSSETVRNAKVLSGTYLLPAAKRPRPMIEAQRGNASVSNPGRVYATHTVHGLEKLLAFVQVESTWVFESSLDIPKMKRTLRELLAEVPIFAGRMRRKRRHWSAFQDDTDLVYDSSETDDDGNGTDRSGNMGIGWMEIEVEGSAQDYLARRPSNHSSSSSSFLSSFSSFFSSSTQKKEKSATELQPKWINENGLVNIPYIQETYDGDAPLMSVTVTRFTKGEGMALGVQINHVIADGYTLSSIVHTWQYVMQHGWDDPGTPRLTSKRPATLNPSYGPSDIRTREKIPISDEFARKGHEKLVFKIGGAKHINLYWLNKVREVLEFFSPIRFRFPTGMAQKRYRFLLSREQLDAIKRDTPCIDVTTGEPIQPSANEALSARLLAAIEEIIPGVSSDSGEEPNEFTNNAKVRTLMQVAHFRERICDVPRTHVGHASFSFSANVTQDGRIQTEVPLLLSESSKTVQLSKDEGRTKLITYHLPKEAIESSVSHIPSDAIESPESKGDDIRPTGATNDTHATYADRLRHRHALLCSGYHAIGAIYRGKTEEESVLRAKCLQRDFERIDRGFLCGDDRFRSKTCFLDDFDMNLASFHSPNRSTPTKKILMQTDMDGFGAGSCLAFIPQNLGNKVQVAPACAREVGGEGGYQVFVNLGAFTEPAHKEQVPSNWFNLVSSDKFYDLLMAGVGKRNE